MKKTVLAILFVLMVFSYCDAKELKLTEVENLKLRNANHRIKDIQQEFQQILSKLQEGAKQKIIPINKEKQKIIKLIEKRLRIKLIEYTFTNDGTLIKIPKKKVKEEKEK